MKIVSILGWVCLAIYAITAASIYIPGRNATGDRGVGLIIPLMMTPAIMLFAAALGFAQYRGWTSALTIIAILLTFPILVLGPGIAGNLYSSYSSSRSEELRGQFRDPVLSGMGAAIRNSDPEKLRALVAAHPKIDWSARDQAGFTLLGLATREATRSMMDVQHANLMCLRVLVEAGAPFQDDAEGRNTRILANLITTVDEDRSEVLTLLIRAGANPNEKDNGGEPALVGIYMEAYKAKILLDGGAELRNLRVQEGQYRGWDALMIAAMRGRWDLAMLYLERGCDPNYLAPDGKSALTIAAAYEEGQNSPKGSALTRDAFVRALTAAKTKAASAKVP